LPKSIVKYRNFFVIRRTDMIRMLSEKPTRTVILEHVLETKVYLKPNCDNDFFSVNC
jgi:hypothetical protein